MSNEPIYCKDCDSKYSWQRYPQGDCTFESGEIFEMCFRCKSCGHITHIPAYDLNRVRLAKDGE